MLKEFLLPSLGPLTSTRSSKSLFFVQFNKFNKYFLDKTKATYIFHHGKNTLPSFLAPRRAIVKEKRKALARSLTDFAEREDADFKKLGDEINQVATLHNEIKEFVDRKQKSESDVTQVLELRNRILSKAFAFFAPDYVFELDGCRIQNKQISIRSGSITSMIEVALIHESSALLSGKIIDGCIVFESVVLGCAKIILPVEKRPFWSICQR